MKYFKQTKNSFFQWLLRKDRMWLFWSHRWASRCIDNSLGISNKFVWSNGRMDGSRKEIWCNIFSRTKNYLQEFLSQALMISHQFLGNFLSYLCYLIYKRIIKAWSDFALKFKNSTFETLWKRSSLWTNYVNKSKGHRIDTLDSNPLPFLHLKAKLWFQMQTESFALIN